MPHARERRRPILIPLAAMTGLSVLPAGCHVVTRSETTRPGPTERIVHAEGAVARRPALVWTDAGQLRFVEPLECPTEEIVQLHRTIELAARPNLATFTVGVIAAAAGGVMLTSGLFAREPAGSPYSYAGGAAVAIGLPLLVGPWLGRGVELRDGGEPARVRRPGPSQACGDRPLAARSATLAVGGIEVHGSIDAAGVFEISPYAWIDAFGATAVPAPEITAVVDGERGAGTITAVLAPGQLAAHARRFLAHGDFDPAIQPVERVPGIVAGALRATLVTGDAGPAVRIVLPLGNDGPGDAWAVRGQITAPGVPAIDGRMIYVGKLPRGAAVSRELRIPITAAASAALRGEVIDVSVELRDAHGTAPSTPVRFRGILLGDAPGAPGTHRPPAARNAPGGQEPPGRTGVAPAGVPRGPATRRAR